MEKEFSARYELPRILYDMLEDAAKENKEYIVSWMPHGRAFKVHNGNAFESKIMPRYFFEKYDSFRYLLEQWGFLRISRGRDRGAYFHHKFIRGERQLCATASKTEMVDAMPDFLSASEEPDLYSYAPAEQDAVPEKPNEPLTVTEEAVEKSLPSDAKSLETIEKNKLKASKPKGGTDEDAKSRDKTLKTKPKPSNKTGKSDPPPRKEKARSKASKKRKVQEDQSAIEPPEPETDTPSPKLSRTQRLLKIPLCRYYLPPLNFSPRPSYNPYATKPFDFPSYGSNEQISKD
jgi:hypothetical protein